MTNQVSNKLIVLILFNIIVFTNSLTIKGNLQKQQTLDTENILLEKPQYSTIINCDVYVNDKQCASCAHGYFLAQDGKECAQGIIENCLEYVDIQRCVRCQQGFSLSPGSQKCQANESSDQQQAQQSGVAWGSGNPAPQSNEIPKPQAEGKEIKQETKATEESKATAESKAPAAEAAKK